MTRKEKTLIGVVILAEMGYSYAKAGTSLCDGTGCGSGCANTPCLALNAPTGGGGGTCHDGCVAACNLFNDGSDSGGSGGSGGSGCGACGSDCTPCSGSCTAKCADDCVGGCRGECNDACTGGCSSCYGCQSTCGNNTCTDTCSDGCYTACLASVSGCSWGQ